MADGFLGRWSRRKLDVQHGKQVEPEPPPAAELPPLPESLSVAAAPRDPVLDDKAAAIQDRPPPPTLDDVAALTPEADFARFVQSDVAPEVRNAAVKKLFADPHFNVMDGLDVYIDDYGKPDPMPESMLRQLASAEFLGLFREEKVPDDVPATAGMPREAADAHAMASVSQSPQPEENPSQGEAAETGSTDPERPSHDAHPDLRLQQDDAPGPEGPGPGPR